MENNNNKNHEDTKLENGIDYRTQRNSKRKFRISDLSNIISNAIGNFFYR